MIPTEPSTTIAVLPGGPGLSSETLNSLGQLRESFLIRFIDPPGIDLEPSNEEVLSYDVLLNHATQALDSIKGKVVLCGHSFGGIQAADIAASARANISALICLSAPFSEASFSSIGRQYEMHMTDELSQTAEEFQTRPTSDSFRKWLGSYGPLYFRPDHSDEGNAMIRSSRVSLGAFLGARAEAGTKMHLLSQLRELKIPKLYLHGEFDLLFTSEVARADAAAGGFEFKSIGNAGHFLAFDSPNEVLKTIKSFLSTITEENR